MKINEIYSKLDNIGCLTFTTIKDNYPISRIAHFFAFDDQGLYFRTMKVKPFYAQLIENGKIAVCGMNADSKVRKDKNNMPEFDAGYTIRLTGEAKEVSINYVKRKAETCDGFALALKDIEKYPAMTVFKIDKFTGEVYDYDFECHHRNHKLARKPFEFGMTDNNNFGMQINSHCTQCGQCIISCSFKAIKLTDGKYKIDKLRCDACGDCTIACKFDAITVTK